MKRFKKIYLEISNICNLSCAFCPGTRRAPRALSASEFAALLPKIVPYTSYLYFHIMGEPLCHGEIGTLLNMAQESGLKVIITTNGTLLSEVGELLIASGAVHKVNVSLHAFEANDIPMSFDEYLDGCFRFGKRAADKKLVIYRLWNSGGADRLNGEILSKMESYFKKPWGYDYRGARLCDRVYADYGERFDWPDMSAECGSDAISCYGLRDQIGILCDGSVVPCCLDHEGDIVLGNLFSSSLDEILSGERARRIIDGFARGHAVEPLCRRCGYARKRFGNA